mmetsp:Transcript_34719/g.53280  ORF Transcript_34719/g.53280 Transcript_34719/m.53280 type:complete len:224 (+) Transcript_34719:1459-2130(+)
MAGTINWFENRVPVFEGLGAEPRVLVGENHAVQAGRLGSVGDANVTVVDLGRTLLALARSREVLSNVVELLFRVDVDWGKDFSHAVFSLNEMFDHLRIIPNVLDLELSGGRRLVESEPDVVVDSFKVEAEHRSCHRDVHNYSIGLASINDLFSEESHLTVHEVVRHWLENELLLSQVSISKLPPITLLQIELKEFLLLDLHLERRRYALGVDEEVDEVLGAGV